MDKDRALTILLENVIKPHLKHSSFDDVFLAYDIMTAMVVLTGKSWTLMPNPKRKRTWIIVDWHAVILGDKAGGH